MDKIKLIELLIVLQEENLPLFASNAAEKLLTYLMSTDYDLE